jgi:hypothetical protein
VDKIIQILSIIVNPWTFLLCVFFVLFRKEVRIVLGSLKNFADNLTEVKYKGLKISAQKKEELLREVQKLALSWSKEGKIKDEQGMIARFSSAIQNDLSEEELSLFMEVFSDSDIVVVRRRSKHEGGLYRLRDGGLVECRKKVMSVPSKGTLQEWVISDVGRVLRDTLRDLR